MPASESIWHAAPVDLSEQDDDEPMGTKNKFWIERESGRWLIKLCRVVDGRTLGEDWAEWLVHRVATLVGIPTAVTEPALVQMGNGARRGIASKDIRDERGRCAYVSGGWGIRTPEGVTPTRFPSGLEGWCVGTGGCV